MLKITPMKTEKINMSTTDFDNLLWCATRYCIGRHSYVSCYAQDFWHIIQRNIEHLEKDRLEFFACDIRAEVSDRINRYSNVAIEFAHNNCIQFDALTLLASYAREHPKYNESETFYEVNCLTGTVEASSWIFESQRSYSIPFQLSNEMDLTYWVLLANCIDNQYEVRLRCNGKERTEMCIRHPIDQSYITVNNWSTSVCDDMIIDVKTLIQSK